MLKRKSGFTLVELLVVIAIIAMLVGLLLPAVNAARASGRRTQNSNNLKNIGLALLSHHEAQNSYPAMRYIGNRATKKAGKNYPVPRLSVSWAFELLPYLEQSNIYDKFDKTLPVYDAANSLAMRSLLPVYANPQQGEARNSCKFAGGGSGTGTCIDYAANRGVYFTDNKDEDQYTMSHAKNQTNVGPFIHNAVVTSAHVKDGASHTIAIGDKWVNIATDPQEVGLTGAASSSIMRGPIVRKTANGYEFVAEENGLFPTRDDPSAQKFGGPAGSGDLMASVFLDGHVKWFEYNVDPYSFAFQLTIDGGEVIQDE